MWFYGLWVFICYRKHTHLNGDISFAMRQYTSMDWNRRWLRENGGCEMIKQLAVFWFSKLQWNNKTNHYDILGRHPSISNLCLYYGMDG